MIQQLTDEQMEFLHLIVKIHNDCYSGFMCNWPAAVERALRNQEYNSGEAKALNWVRADYIKWKNKEYGKDTVK